MSTQQLEQGQLVAQDDTRFLARQFTGHVVGQPAMGYAPLLATVSAVYETPTGDLVEVTIAGFNNSAATTGGAGTPSFLCYYQPVPTPSGGAQSPPVGTKCYVAFPPNEAQGHGVVVAFRGWPG